MVESRIGVDQHYFYVSWEVAGDKIYDGDDENDHGYDANYYAYFGIPNNPDFVLNLAGGKAQDLSSEFTRNPDPKIFQDFKDGASDVPGPGGVAFDLGITGQEGDGFESELSDAMMHSRRNGSVVEIVLQISSIGLQLEDFIDLNYVFSGTAESNPSSPGDLFVNDHFDDPLLEDQGVEYDNTRVSDLALSELNTVISEIPEPSTSLLVVLGLYFLGLRQRRRA